MFKVKESFIKKFLTLFLALLVCFVFVGCGETPTPEPEDSRIQVSTTSGLTPEQKIYTFKFDYDESYFSGNTKEFNKNLALLSFGSSIAAQTKADVLKFFNDLEFDSIKLDSYEQPDGANLIKFAFAHKVIDEANVIAVSMRGLNYSLEWINNCLVGASANHLGFSQNADIVFAALKDYIEENEFDDNLKLWITGYSKGGAVANVLTHQILTTEEIAVTDENMFVYTFEAPRALDAENAVSYENVFNIINSSDVITKLLPEQYGLFRCGQDVNIGRSDAAQIIKAFDADIVLPDFVEEDVDDGEEKSFTNLEEFEEFVIECLTRECTDPETQKDISTREGYVENMQGTIMYALNLAFSLDADTINQIKNDLSEMGIMDLMGLLAENAFFEFLTPYLDEAQFEYDETELSDACETLRQFILTPAGILTLSIGMNYKDNLMLAIDMHYPETVFALLSNFTFEN